METPPMPAPAPQLGFGDVLKNRPIRRLWIAQIVSVFGDFLALFAIFSVVTFQMHGTPVEVSMILVAYLCRWRCSAPLAGVFVDKWNVKMDHDCQRLDSRRSGAKPGVSRTD